MRLLLIALLALFVWSTTAAQSSLQATDTIPVTEKKWEATFDMVSRYIWRGQAWGGNYPAIQPSFTYDISRNWSVGIWGTTNLQKNFYEDGSENKGYHEFDLGISYAINSFLKAELWDYYWPVSEEGSGNDHNYFNYGPSSVKSVDLSLVFDFSDYKYPFNATVSTLVAGNDFRYDRNGGNPVRNFTTYLEAGYTFEDFLRSVNGVLRNVSLSPTVGAVLNNRAGYYAFADYDRLSFVNIAVSAQREVDLGYGCKTVLSVNFTHNAANRNTETNGRNFLTAGMSIVY